VTEFREGIEAYKLLTHAIRNIETGLEYRYLDLEKRRKIERVLTRYREAKFLLLANQVSEATCMLLDANKMFLEAI